MQLISTLAAAAAVSSAVATSVPAGNSTFAPTSTTQVAVSLSTAAPSTPAGHGAPVSPSEVKKLLDLSVDFQFEVRGGLCAITHMPAAAAVVSWRLVVDVDLGVKYFEICRPEQSGRVVTKVQGQYVFGAPVRYQQSASGAVDLVCDSGVYTQYEVGAGAVVEVAVKAELVANIGVPVLQCQNVAECRETTCEGDKCGVNLVAKVEAPVYQSGAPVYQFEECEPKPEVECSCVKTCVATECQVQQPPSGPAPAPLPAEEVVTIFSSTPAPAKPAAEVEVSHQPKKPVVAPPATAPASNSTGAGSAKPAPAQVGRAGRAVAALNVLAGVVALALV